VTLQGDQSAQRTLFVWNIENVEDDELLTYSMAGVDISRAAVMLEMTKRHLYTIIIELHFVRNSVHVTRCHR